MTKLFKLYTENMSGRAWVMEPLNGYPRLSAVFYNGFDLETTASTPIYFNRSLFDGSVLTIVSEPIQTKNGIGQYVVTSGGYKYFKLWYPSLY